MTEQERAGELRRMKRFATALLLFATALFVITRLFDDHGTWIGYVEAFAEAAMVGALADWFAVTALFRHPLALPIPHTAIIPRRKDQIGRTLGDFVQGEFLTASAINERLRGFGIARRAGGWLATEANARRTADAVADLLRAGLEVIDDDQVSDGLETMVERRLLETPMAPLLSRALTAAVEGGHHQQALDAMLKGVGGFLDDNRATLRRRLEQESPWWVPEAIDDKVFLKVFDGVQRFLADVRNDPQHEMRASLSTRLESFAERLTTDPGMIERAEQIKRDALQHPEVRAWLRSLWTEAKRGLTEATTDRTSDLHAHLASAARSVGERIAADPAMIAKVDSWVERAVGYVVDNYRHEVGDMIASTVEKWDAGDTSRKLELQIGRDLQFIRINGTLVGGLAGLVIHTVGRLL